MWWPHKRNIELMRRHKRLAQFAAQLGCSRLDASSTFSLAAAVACSWPDVSPFSQFTALAPAHIDCPGWRLIRRCKPGSHPLAKLAGDVGCELGVRRMRHQFQGGPTLLSETTFRTVTGLEKRSGRSSACRRRPDRQCVGKVRENDGVFVSEFQQAMSIGIGADHDRGACQRHHDAHANIATRRGMTVILCIRRDLVSRLRRRRSEHNSEAC